MITSIRELPVGKFEQLATDGDDMDRRTHNLSVLSGISEDKLLDLPIGEFSRLMAQSNFLDDEIDIPEVRRSYSVGKWELVPTKDINKMTAGQFIDFQTWVKDPDKNRVQMASSILVPKGKKYADGYDVQEVQDAIREHLSIADCVAVNAFFLRLLQRYIIGSLTYLGWILTGKICLTKDKNKKAQLKKMLQEQKETLNSVRHGVG